MQPAVRERLHDVVRASGIKASRALQVGGRADERSLLRSPEIEPAERWCLTRHPREGAEDIRTVTWSGDAMPFEDESFDLVVSNAALQRDAHFWRCAAEMRRVLRPGGLLVIGVPGFTRLESDRDGTTVTSQLRSGSDYYRFSRRAVKQVLFAGMEDVTVEAVLEPPRLVGAGRKPAQRGRKGRAASRRSPLVRARNVRRRLTRRQFLRKPSVWFVTPAWRRFELSRVCFAQRARVIEHLREHGVDAQCVVVADDENLEIAAELGFATVKRNNRWLGRRFNDGYERALRAGARFVIPIGSDTWLDPDLVLRLIEGPDKAIRATRSYAVVSPDGRSLGQIGLFGELGFVAWAIPGKLILKTGWRPCRERIDRGCDRSTFRRLQSANGTVDFDERTGHGLEVVGFQSDVQVTAYNAYQGWYEVTEYEDPFDRLAERYPAELVAAARRLYDV